MEVFTEGTFHISGFFHVALQLDISGKQIICSEVVSTDSAILSHLFCDWSIGREIKNA